MRNLKLSHRILIAMFALIFFSFITVGLITIIRYQSKNKSYHKERLQRKDRAVVESIKFMTNESQGLYNRFKNLNNISHIHKLDLQIFDLQGLLVLSSKKSDNGNYVLTDTEYQQIDSNTFLLLNQEILKNEKNINNGWSWIHRIKTCY